MRWIAPVALFVAGLIHLLPVPGVLGPAWLQRLYLVDVSHSADLQVLLQHRALLFGVLGLFMWSAIHWPSWRVAACLVGLASAGSFIIVAWVVGGYNQALHRVVVADVLVCVLLAAALWALWVDNQAHGAQT